MLLNLISLENLYLFLNHIIKVNWLKSVWNNIPNIYNNNILICRLYNITSIKHDTII
jgi:hypothetical protein